jgi:hypothetical protein
MKTLRASLDNKEYCLVLSPPVNWAEFQQPFLTTFFATPYKKSIPSRVWLEKTIQNLPMWPGVMVHACNSSTSKTEPGGS